MLRNCIPFGAVMKHSFLIESGEKMYTDSTLYNRRLKICLQGVLEVYSNGRVNIIAANYFIDYASELHKSWNYDNYIIPL